MKARTVQLVVLVALVAGYTAEPVSQPIIITNGQGEIAGEVTANSVILHSRLTTEAVIVDGDILQFYGSACELASQTGADVDVTYVCKYADQ